MNTQRMLAAPRVEVNARESGPTWRNSVPRGAGAETPTTPISVEVRVGDSAEIGVVRCVGRGQTNAGVLRWPSSGVGTRWVSRAEATAMMFSAHRPAVNSAT